MGLDNYPSPTIYFLTRGRLGDQHKYSPKEGRSSEGGQDAQTGLCTLSQFGIFLSDKHLRIQKQYKGA